MRFQEKISMDELNNRSFRETFEDFVISKRAIGVEDVTVRNYYDRLKMISIYLDIDRPLKEITKRDIEKVISQLRDRGIKHNTLATYVRFLQTFYNWCSMENLVYLKIPNIKERDTVKEVYTDEELRILLKRPDKGCDFGEYRSWVLINFLMNSGCRAATARNIQNRDVDLAAKRVIFRHNKNKKIQTIPICSSMCQILSEYMKIRKGADEDYLFCNVYGEQLTEDAMRHAITRYNRGRGISKTSIHLFRNTFAKMYLLECHGNAFTLQALMGHSTLKMTKHYCQIFNADIAKDYDEQSPLMKINAERNRIKVNNKR